MRCGECSGRGTLDRKVCELCSGTKEVDCNTCEGRGFVGGPANETSTIATASNQGQAVEGSATTDQAGPHIVNRIQVQNDIFFDGGNGV